MFRNICLLFTFKEIKNYWQIRGFLLRILLEPDYVRWAGTVFRAGSLSRANIFFNYMSFAGKKKSQEIRNKMAEQDVNMKKLNIIASL